MTGFGKAVTMFDGKRLTAEVKSLNSKQLDLTLRLPHRHRALEAELRNVVSQRLVRGKVELAVTCENTMACGTAPVAINVPRLKCYKEQIEAMSQELGIAPPDDWYATLLRLPEVLTPECEDSDPDAEESQCVKTVVGQALDQLVTFRRQEGERLERFFEEKINCIEQLLLEVPKHECGRVDKIKARILESLKTLEVPALDNNRLEQELIFYIEKLDITEEKTRLQNHLKYFLHTLHDEKVQGKKLGFISQEMGREINTLGSKANEAELQKVVVRMKDHLEQIKEQVLNVL